MLSSEELIREIARSVRPRLPDGLRGDLDFYVEESLYGLSRIGADLQTLSPSSRILEIGAGSFLLSAALAGAGRTVTALEPVGPGFSFFAALQAAVADEAEGRGYAFRRMRCGIEDLAAEDEYDFVFAIHVFEHVPDIVVALQKAYRALRPGGRMFILCPNYAFPYEVHFKVPLVFNKSVTFRLFRARIEGSKSFAEPSDVWRSLNWITARTLTRAVRRLPGATIRFRARSLEDAIERAAHDPALARRHPRIVIAASRLAVRTCLHRLSRLLGATFAPLIEAHIEKPLGSASSGSDGG